MQDNKIQFFKADKLEIILDTCRNISKEDFFDFYGNSDFFICYKAENNGDDENKKNQKIAFNTLSGDPEEFRNAEKEKFVYELPWDRIDWEKTGWEGYSPKRMGIGRSTVREVQMVIDNPSISKWHGLFLKRSTGLFYKDIGSSYGTLFNRKEINSDEEHLIEEGSILQFGEDPTKLTYWTSLRLYQYLTSSLLGN